VELVSNLIWAVIACCLLSMTYLCARRRTATLPMGSAMMLTVLVCFILLPAISISDDLLAARQAVLPQSAQSWSMASQDASVGLKLVIPVITNVLLLNSFGGDSILNCKRVWGGPQFAARLVRSQRLRPPLCVA
jgi:hypothetical protein